MIISTPIYLAAYFPCTELLYIQQDCLDITVSQYSIHRLHTIPLSLKIISEWDTGKIFSIINIYKYLNKDHNSSQNRRINWSTAILFSALISVSYLLGAITGTGCSIIPKSLCKQLI